MSISYFDPDDLRIQLAIAKERLQFAEEREKLKIDLEVTKQQLAQAQDSLAAIRQEKKKKSLLAKGLAFIASLLFLSVSAASSIGVNELTATPPNPILGWTVMSIAVIIHLATTLASIFLDIGGQ